MAKQPNRNRRRRRPKASHSPAAPDSLSATPPRWTPLRNRVPSAAAIRAWFARPRHLLLLGFVLVALLLRIPLALNCPQPWGYAYDEYHEGVAYLFYNGELPPSEACWQCYHPPVFYVAGYPFYYAGVKYYLERYGPEVLQANPRAPAKFLNFLSFLAAMTTVVYACRILRLYRVQGMAFVWGVALLMVFPRLFISSWSAEADIVLTAIMTALLFYLLRYAMLPDPVPWRLPIVLGVLCGLAMATKYNGLAGLATAGAVTLARGVRTRRFARMFADGPVILLICLLIGSWKYTDNIEKFGTPLFANGSAAQGFSIDKEYRWDIYDFASFRYGDVLDSMGPDAPPGQLTELPVYYSVWTSLHALAWTDMGMFTVGGRHGAPWDMYPHRAMPLWPAAALLALALLPNALALLGAGLTIHRRQTLPLLLLTVITTLAYFQWVLSQTAWALKAKYILFLLPVYLVYVLLAMRWIERKAPKAVTRVLWGGLWAVVGLCYVYAYYFSTAQITE
ncbi:MAG: hypothetical protein PWP23_2142 [Candidatus Sumerlaeota bacterium]|nr:hypothetical protein [Candidatus Sumerlaeota bacterium]